MTAHELRLLQKSSIRLSKFTGDTAIISGLAVPYGTWAEIHSLSGDRFLERIQRGAMKDSLENGSGVGFYLHHDWDNSPIGSTESNLRLIDKPDGLYFEIVIDPSDEVGLKVINGVQSGLVGKCSIAFRPITERWDEEGWYGMRTRTVTGLALYEISLTANPAYIEATATVNRILGSKCISSTIETARVGACGVDLQTNNLIY
ncbi:HK97 family phage prohead protease [Paenibacillus sp. MCAF9]|uniref:HK97 family phage prohead protease n=1 Tax=Paenibacillus sp. MCAF9 TaxID=3233046 RepID=UPI003F97AEF6